MIIKKFFVAVILVHTVCETICAIVRPARIGELQEVVDLDRRIGYEYFIPLFLQYTDLPLGQRAIECLERDLREGEGMYESFIRAVDNKGLYVAIENNRIEGLIVFHKQEHHLFIDLLIVTPDHRGKGIGTQLMHAAYIHFSDVSNCVVAMFDKNLPAIRFYESRGFTRGKPAEIVNEYPAEYAHVYLFYQQRIRK